MGLLRRVVVVVVGAVGAVGAIDAVGAVGTICAVGAVGAVGALVVCGDGINVVVVWVSMSRDEWKWMFVAVSVWMLLYIAASVCADPCVRILSLTLFVYVLLSYTSLSRDGIRFVFTRKTSFAGY